MHVIKFRLNLRVVGERRREVPVVTSIAILAVAEKLNFSNKLTVSSLWLSIRNLLRVFYVLFLIEFLSRYKNILKLAESPTSGFTIVSW